jgi:polysaccharide deacetylase family protein (PEP-CTERM system associated)
MNTSLGPRHVMSVDVEDWDQNVRQRFLHRVAPATTRVVSNTHILLKLFARRRVQATFFVLGRIAEEFPALVREIAQAGHEVGTHGYSHRLVDELGPERFRAELRRSIRLLEDLTGQRVVSHRAAEFSITPRTPWAWEILAEEGIQYDSSVFPISHPRYGWPDAPTQPHRVDVQHGSLWECPLPALRVGPRAIPVGGGGYLRWLPYSFTRRALQAIVASGRPIVVYLHPHEFDPTRLHLPSAPRSTRLQLFELLQNVNRGTVAQRRTDRLVREFPMGTLREAAGSWAGA